ncbi:hypothetical protein [Providencia sp. MGF014]|uniref:hypothetical protein n=1 Tax=Providencia sp. MGF014 TaxID=2565573 RepID=UPI00109CF1CE|nr:hypothetical protein [Providencia sp. MGF014]THB27344.1 hypothetical protein E6R27_08875 [Providencia sp. MGF014]
MKKILIFGLIAMLTGCNENDNDKISGVYYCKNYDRIILVKEKKQFIGGEQVALDADKNEWDPVSRIKYLSKFGNYLNLSNNNTAFYLLGNNELGESRLKVLDENYDGYYENWCVKKEGIKTARSLMDDHL